MTVTSLDPPLDVLVPVPVDVVAPVVVLPVLVVFGVVVTPLDVVPVVAASAPPAPLPPPAPLEAVSVSACVPAHAASITAPTAAPTAPQAKLFMLPRASTAAARPNRLAKGGSLPCPPARRQRQDAPPEAAVRGAHNKRRKEK